MSWVVLTQPMGFLKLLVGLLNILFNGEPRCDGDRDCEDGTDELGCLDYPCAAWQFKCVSTGICVHKGKFDQKYCGSGYRGFYFLALRKNGYQISPLLFH